VAGVYVASYTPSGSFPFRLERFDPLTLTLQEYIDDMASPAIAAANLWAAGTAGNAGNIYRLNRDDVSDVLATVNVGSVSLLNGTNDRLYLTELTGNTSSDRTDRLDPDDGSVVWSVSGTVCGPNPTKVIDDGTHAYVVNAEGTARTITKLDASDGSFVDDVQLLGEPFDMTLVGTDLYVLRGTTAMDRIDTSTMTATSGVLTAALGGIATDQTDVFLSQGGIGFSGALRYDVGSQTTAEGLSLSAGQAGAVAALDVEFYATGYSGTTGSVTRLSLSPLTFEDTTTLFGYPQVIAVLYANPVTSGWGVNTINW